MSRTDGMPTRDGVEHHFVDVRGARLHVAELGDPDGPPVLLLHGWPQHWWSWRELIGPLARRHRVICPDIRGMGWSDVPRGGYGVRRRAISTAVPSVVGESVGVVPTIPVAAPHPARGAGPASCARSRPFSRNSGAGPSRRTSGASAATRPRSAAAAAASGPGSGEEQTTLTSCANGG